MKGTAGRASFNSGWDTAQRTPLSVEQANRQTTHPRGQLTGSPPPTSSSGVLTPTPRSRLGTKVKNTHPFPRVFALLGFCLCLAPWENHTVHPSGSPDGHSHLQLRWTGKSRVHISVILQNYRKEQSSESTLRSYACLTFLGQQQVTLTIRSHASYTRGRPALPDIELHEALRVGTDFEPSRTFLKIMRGERAQAG